LHSIETLNVGTPKSKASTTTNSDIYMPLLFKPPPLSAFVCKKERMSLVYVQKRSGTNLSL